MSQQTVDDRARAAFGQSLRSEEWAVRANELGWRVRRSRLLAFQSRESGCSDPAAFHDRDADDYQADYDKHYETMFGPRSGGDA
jgi:hypothetical protein